MPRGISLHVGVNELDPDCFASVPLDGCVNDATAMYYVAKAHGFTDRRLLVDGDATFERVTAALRQAAGQLKDDGDVFLFTFAGHGTQVPDFDEEPDDKKDETMVLHDRILLDDELRRRYWPMFNPGVRIIFVTDSCHNGTVSQLSARAEVGIGENVILSGGGVSVFTSVSVTATLDAPISKPRELPPGTGEDHIMKFSHFYDELTDSRRPAGPLQCSVLHLAACKDELATPDGPTHGVFTQALLDVLGRDFGGNYEEFRLAIADETAHVPGGRRPFIEEIGVLSPHFKEQHPVFAI